MAEVVEVLALEALGDALSVTLTRRQRVVPNDEDLFDLVIVARGHPFAGEVHEIVTVAEIGSMRTNLRAMSVPGRLVVGGDRAAELTIETEAQDGGPSGAIAVEVSLTGGGEPWPRLTWLLFDQQPFWNDAADALDDLIGR